jgi:stage II sporulation protein R
MKALHLLRNTLKKHALTLSMLIGAVISVMIAGFSSFAGECEKLPDSVLRLHIIANSDSKADQDFKLQLRDFILDNFSSQLQACDSLESACNAAEDLLEEIQIKATEFALLHDCETQIKAEITQMYFTTRIYDSGTLPAGYYTALRITIGEGKGKNWWCVMFPLLCVPAVGETQAAPVINLPETVTDSPKIKFAVFEFLSGLFK